MFKLGNFYGSYYITKIIIIKCPSKLHSWKLQSLMFMWLMVSSCEILAHVVTVRWLVGMDSSLAPSLPCLGPSWKGCSCLAPYSLTCSWCVTSAKSAFSKDMGSTLKQSIWGCQPFKCCLAFTYSCGQSPYRFRPNLRGKDIDLIFQMRGNRIWVHSRSFIL